MIPLHLAKAFSDPEFLAAVNADPEIAALEKERISTTDELAALCQVLGGQYRIEPAAPARRWRLFRRDRSVTLRPITAAVWSIWWALDSAFVTGSHAANELDSDIALFTLMRKPETLAGSSHDIARAAAGTCRKHGFNWQDIAEVVAILAKDALRPLEMLPPAAETAEAPEFGADWLTRITGTVAQRMNYPAHLIAVERPLAEVALQFCWEFAANDSKAIVKRRTPEDICSAIWDRTIKLAEKFNAS